MTVNGSDNEQDEIAQSKAVIRLTISPRFYLIPGTAFVVGSIIGFVRGARRASLRFLAENVHRPPTTVQGWYFYNKTKNYRVLYGGMKAAGTEASKLALVSLGYVTIEEGLWRSGWGQFQEVGAGVGTAGVFSAVYRLPWRATQRTLVLGLIMGSGLKMLSWTKGELEQQASILGENTAQESDNKKVAEP